MPASNSSPVPSHVALIMDGNGRWANERGLPRTKGHEAGEEALYDVLLKALDLGIGWLTVYAFSTENWRRPIQEVKFLMNFNESVLMRRRNELHERGVRVRIAGAPDSRIPSRVLAKMQETVELTAGNDRLNFTVAFNYGGRTEILDAFKAYAAAGGDPADVDEETLSRFMYVPEMPAPDLIIRTSGEYRTSNFLVWESVYSEWYFTDTLWPDFRGKELAAALDDFQSRDRRFGGVRA